MAFVHSYPTPVVDHFLASGTTAERNSGGAEDDGPGYSPASGEVCENCYAYCADKAELWRHVRDEHGADRRLVCQKSGCGKRFSAVAMSAAHAAHHRDGRQRAAATDGDRPPLTCELCGRLMGNLTTFRKHMAKTHPGAAAALCGVCYLYTGDVPSLVEHVRRTHGATGKPAAAAAAAVAVRTTTPDAKKRRKPSRHVILCDVCGKQYGNYRNMYRHRAVHGTVEFDPRSPFVALPSPKRFTTVSRLRPY